MSMELSVAEAARCAGLTNSGIRHAIRAGRISVRLVDGTQVVDAADTERLKMEVAARRRRIADRAELARAASSPRRTLPAAPLLQQVALRGGASACGVHQHSAEQEALRLAKLYGRLTPRAAEHLAVEILGATPWELWPDFAA